jgi:hypothetical protein
MAKLTECQGHITIFRSLGTTNMDWIAQVFRYMLARKQDFI